MKIGCNYWASHAGTSMWKNWDENVVRNDLKMLSEMGCEMLRVFPNWKDFQPIEIARTCGGWVKDIYMKGKPLPDTFCGQAGVDEEMLRRFRRFAEIAEEYNMTLRVALVTGWMSGSFLCPDALDADHIQTNPLALRFMVKFIRCFVRSLKDCKAIEEWELGNECNNLEELHDTSSAWLWTHLVSSAIRLEDPDRKVSSGMHGLRAASPFSRECIWNLQTQGELCDRITPHPYPHSGSKMAAKADTHNSFRTILESSFELLYYSDIVNLPGSVEEIGSLSSAFASESLEAIFLRGALYNCWAYGASDFLWWCAFDQGHLKFPPYCWSAYERELGLFNSKLQPKKLTEEFKAFKAFKDALPVKELPPLQRDAVCIAQRTPELDTALSNACSSFLLAKQNNFDIRYNYCMDHDPEAPLYLLPCIAGDCGLYGYEWDALTEKVKNGAVLYVSMDDCSINYLPELFGVEIAGREVRTAPAKITFEGEEFTVSGPVKSTLNVLDAEVLACEEDGNPVFVRHNCGKGVCYLFTLPLEKYLGNLPGAFHKPEQPAWRKFYAPLAEHVKSRRRISCSNPLVTLTEHPESETSCWAVAVNNSNECVDAAFAAAPGWQLETDEHVELAPFTGKLLKLIKK